MTPAATALGATVLAGWPDASSSRSAPDVALPAVLTGGAPTIGLRVPDHPTPRALARGRRAAPDDLGQPLRGAGGDGRRRDRRRRSAADIDLILDGGPAHGGPPRRSWTAPATVRRSCGSAPSRRPDRGRSSTVEAIAHDLPHGRTLPSQPGPPGHPCPRRRRPGPGSIGSATRRPGVGPPADASGSASATAIDGLRRLLAAGGRDVRGLTDVMSGGRRFVGRYPANGATTEGVGAT